MIMIAINQDWIFQILLPPIQTSIKNKSKFEFSAIFEGYRFLI